MWLPANLPLSYSLLCTSIFSAGNTYTYCAIRTLYGLPSAENVHYGQDHGTAMTPSVTDAHGQLTGWTFQNGVSCPERD